MRTATHNVWVGQKPADVRDHLIQLRNTQDWPTAFMLQEAHRFDGTIPGYDRIAWDKGHRDNSNCVLLVRKEGVEIVRKHFVQPKGPWWEGPKHDQNHPPRIFPGATIRTEGHLACLLCVHGIPNRAKNPAAARHEWAALEKWANGRKYGRPVIMSGDWNAREDDPRLKQFARETHMRIDLRGIDGPLDRDIRLINNVKLASKYGSDGHHPVVSDWRF